MCLAKSVVLALAALCVSADPTDPPAKAAPNVTVTEVCAPHGLPSTPCPCSCVRVPCVRARAAAVEDR